jgi:hypothetical protein
VRNLAKHTIESCEGPVKNLAIIYSKVQNRTKGFSLKKIVGKLVTERNRLESYTVTYADDR